jgi:HAD superfamily hydrolase (TIGR01509 family)
MGEVIYHTLGMNRTGRNEYFRKYIREDFPFEEFGRLTRDNFWKIVDKEGLPLKKGVKELLAYGKAQGYKMAVATSSSREYAMGNLIRAGIDPYFDSVICGDMVKKAKPDPEIYQKACESLGIQPEYCMAFEDAPGGILSAHQAGMQVIMVPDLVQPTEEIRKLTYRVCDSLADVIGILN